MARDQPEAASAETEMGRAAPGFLFDLAPDGVCHAAGLAAGPGGLLHRHFTLTRLATGGMFSVALSILPDMAERSPPLPTGRPALWSPDFPLPPRLAAQQQRPDALFLDTKN